MTFDEIKTIKMTPEQANTHIAALVTHIKRMERKLVHNDRKIAEYLKIGDSSKANAEMKKKQYRIYLIVETEKELARMRQIFGETENAESRN